MGGVLEGRGEVVDDDGGFDGKAVDLVEEVEFGVAADGFVEFEVFLREVFDQGLQVQNIIAGVLGGLGLLVQLRVRDQELVHLLQSHRLLYITSHRTDFEEMDDFFGFRLHQQAP